MPQPILDGPEILVNTATLSNQFEPSITALADGRFVVAWTDASATGGDTSGYAIRAQVFNADGNKAGTEFLVNTTVASVQFEPSITALADGRFVVSWTDLSATGGDTSGSAIRAQVFDADGSKAGAEVLVNTTVASSQYASSITALADGRFVVAWTDDSATSALFTLTDIRAQVFNADGSKAGAEFLVNTETFSHQGQPSITALADGRFVVSWTDQSGFTGDTSGHALRAQVFNADGSKAGAEFPVNTTTFNSQVDSSITALADGRFVVAWSDVSATGGDTSSVAIRAQVFDAGGSKAGAEFLVNTTVAGTQVEPSITALADGRFVVAWTDQSATGGDTSASAVRAQVFNANGSKAGAEFLVNTTVVGSQSQSSITALADGRFVVSWSDFSAKGGDTSGLAIRAQIIDPRVGVLEVISGTDTQPRQMDHYDLVSVLSGSNLVSLNAAAIRSENANATHGTVVVAGAVQALASFGQRDAISLTGTATGLADGLGGHHVTVLAGGSVLSTTGNGITLAGIGAEVTNFGVITGVNYGVQSLGGTMTVTNSGTIGGSLGAILGGIGSEQLFNAGTLLGNVQLGAGNDLYDGRLGQITGSVSGDDGLDRLLGGAQDDSFDGGLDDDTLHGGGGDDGLAGGDGNDVIRGNVGDDALDGGVGRDTLLGGGGDDKLTGGNSADLMSGGLGQDVFIFMPSIGIGRFSGYRDIITDFTAGVDVVDLSAVDASAVVAGNQAFTFIGSVAFTNVAGQLRYATANGLLQGDLNGDGVADFALELASRPALLVTDILL